MRIVERLKMNPEDKQLLESWIRAKTTPQRVVFRAQICLLAEKGHTAAEIAQTLSTSRPTVALWKKRFEEHGPAGLNKDAPRGPSPRKLDAQLKNKIVETTLNSTPPDTDHWTTRSLAKALGLSNATIARVWKSQGIRAKSKKNQKAGKSKEDKESHSELVGVYIDAPLKALIFSRNGEDNHLIPNTLNVEPTGLRGQCLHCISATLDILDTVIPVAYSDKSIFPDFEQFLERFQAQAPDDRFLHLIIHGAVDSSRTNSDLKIGKYHVHVYPIDFGKQSAIQDLSLRSTGLSFSKESALTAQDLIRKIARHLSASTAGGRPFTWIKQSTRSADESWRCTGTSAYLGGFAMAPVGNSSKNQYEYNRRLEKEAFMNWKEKFEAWFSAAAFAEEGEHTVAMALAGIKPQPKAAMNPKPSFSTIFASAAFAEGNCHDMALELLGEKRRRSFIEVVGLQGVRVWQGSAQLQNSFAESVGLAGVKHRLVTISI